MSTQPITRVYAWYEATLKGKRKPSREYKLLATLDNHQIITPDAMNDYERIFKRLITEDFEAGIIRALPKTAQIKVNHGELDGEIAMIRLLPKQTQLVML